MSFYRWHPAWCDPDSCSAYDLDVEDERLHRSAPVVVPTSDNNIKLYINRWPEVDGSDQYIELSEREGVVDEPWYLGVPRSKPVGGELLLDMDVAEAVEAALRDLAHA